jgi:hypothetical protein
MTKEPKPIDPFLSLGPSGMSRRFGKVVEGPSISVDEVKEIMASAIARGAKVSVSRALRKLVKGSDGGAGSEKRKAANMPGSVPGVEMSDPASRLVRGTVQGAALDPRTGVTPGPSETTKRGRGRPRKAISEQPWEAEGISRALWYRRQKEKRNA